ncbi:allophanate hydrolase [Nakamurella sp. YIM 132087]|uniref:Allophanate hydrolase n=1 Tax=Nakamurella alba TaxID=2665158 RepID=A0A7K1FG79_9ACTN|nr:allophanate hydrolase [Nakamurella alba]MTD13102.1 allophanate hydrolase [Nakamurella alba]
MLDEDLSDIPMTVAGLLAAYRSGATTPAAVIARVLEKIRERGDDGVWITVADRAMLDARLREVADLPRDLPLWGIPFGVKDSLDVRGWPTTLACPGWSRVATDTAPAVQALLDAGAVMIGKNNLDQFATGLNGTRSPYGIPRSVFDDEMISGGSSSGSAVAVALGEVPFAVATDTAGSGRVPPALNGIPGFKPSRGLISTVGLVPACRSLDCVSLIAGTVDDLATVFDVVSGVDERDAWSRPRRRTTMPAPEARIGLPEADELDFFGDDAVRQAHLAARDAIAGAFPERRQVPLAPFLAAGELLYQGPWVAERYLEFGDFMAGHPDAVHPVVAGIIASGAQYTAVDVFRAQYRMAELRAEVGRIFEEVDVLVLPTIGTTFTVAQVLADPVATNTTLGHYTHFGNLLDLCALTVPTGVTADGRPSAAMILGPALSDDLVLRVGAAVAALPHALAPVH